MLRFPPSCFIQFDSGLQQFLNQTDRQGIVWRKLNRSLRGSIRLQFVSMTFDRSGARKEAAMLFKSGVRNQQATIEFERRYLIADYFDRPRHDRLDRLPQILERDASWR